MRSVWDVATQALADDHYAPYPEELPRRCILAGTAPRACALCGAPWRRRIERHAQTTPVAERYGRQSHNGMAPQQSGHFWTPPDVVDHGFFQSCDCADNTGSGRCVVLDPFAGSGTTGRVAEKLGRDAILIDLGYQELQEKRTNGVQVEMEAYL